MIMNETGLDTSLRDLCGENKNILDLRQATDEVIAGFLYSSTEMLIILTLYPTALTVGFVGNIAFLAVIALVPEMRTITNTYLGNLAIADMVFLATLNYDVLMGFLLSPSVKMKPYWSSFGCGFRVGLQFTAHVAIVGIILLVTMERYFGICKPLMHRAIVAKGRTMKLIATAWSVGLLFSSLVIPSVAVFKNTCVAWPETAKYNNLPTMLKSCNSVLPVFGMFHDILLVPLLTVLLINMIMYARIIIELNGRAVTKGDEPLQDMTEAELAKNRDIRNQVARLLIATGTFFFFCCVPEFTVHLNRLILTLTDFEVGFKMTPKQKWYVVWLARGMTTTSAVMNPILYGLTSSRYRDAFKKLFRCTVIEKQLQDRSGSSRGSSLGTSRSDNGNTNVSVVEMSKKI